MNNYKLEAILAKAMLDLCTDNFNFDERYLAYQNGKLIELGSQSKIEQIKELFDAGLNPLAVRINEQQKTSILINDIIATNDNTDIVEMALSYITPERFTHLSYSAQEKIMMHFVLFEQQEYIETLFKNGFRLIQGTKEECALECKMLHSANSAFFEVLYHYQPDFDFNKKYLSQEDNSRYYTLSEIIKDEISYTVHKPYKEKLINLQQFINSASLYQSFSHSLDDNKICQPQRKV